MLEPYVLRKVCSLVAISIAVCFKPAFDCTGVATKASTFLRTCGFTAAEEWVSVPRSARFSG